MSDTSIVKLVHIMAVALSISGFVLRGLWILSGNSYLRTKIVRITPHIIDTILLGSAIYLVIPILQQSIISPWLTAKIIGLFGYIGFGLVAFRFGKAKQVRVASWLAAIVVFGYITAVAITKNPYLVS